LYQVNQIRYYQAPRAQGEQAMYVLREGELGEHWICDGEATFEFNNREKTVYERPLPVHMRGEAIAEGPLPFLFGAEAAKLKQRYWIAPLTPPKDGNGNFVQDEYWLAVKPKTRQDASNFELVELILDKKEFLPKAMQIYLPGGQERKVFHFADRTVNPPFQFLQRDFSKPRIPLGWKKVVDDGGAAAPRAALAPTSGVRPASHVPVGPR
ncbi:MAG: hypothetical protein KDA41_00435, partial [Planctomycetales bacterium]|nr:hypothetical protein [Planctomycetales bacterium]